MEQELRDRWAMVVAPGRAADQALAALLARHREPHRRYHGLAHVLRVLRTIDELLASVAVDDPDAVRLAAWFHDAVYDPRAAGNEAASAALASSVLAQLDQPASRTALVAHLVDVTAGHDPSTPDEKVLVDADLAVLGADPATYQAYARGVRAEYAHVDDDAWHRGRAAVLQGFLDRPAIFHTAPMQAREARARANLTAELAELAGLAGLAGLRDNAPPSTAPTRAVPSRAVADAPDTVTEAVQLLRAQGYANDLEVVHGAMRCSSCATAHPFDRLVADHVFRFEGDSDPGDEAIVIGVTCPACGAKGILVSPYGPDADPDELEGILMVAERYAQGP